MDSNAILWAVGVLTFLIVLADLTGLVSFKDLFSRLKSGTTTTSVGKKKSDRMIADLVKQLETEDKDAIEATRLEQVRDAVRNAARGGPQVPPPTVPK